MLEIEDLFPAMERALIDFSAGRLMQPVRSVLPVPQYGGWFALMPAVCGDFFGAKLVTVFPDNAEQGLATHQALIQLFRSDTGSPVAVLSGETITALRTAVVSALATRVLAPPEASTLAILGSGVQARSHFRALRLVRDFNEVRVWSRSPEHASKLAAEIGAKVTSVENAVRGADVIVTVTNAKEPILQGAWLKPGAHVNAVGAVGPKARELDDAAMKNSAIVVESCESALRESGEIMHSGAAIYAELGELLAGTKPRPQAGTTVYKSLGIAVEDVAAARIVYEQAIRKPAPYEL